MTTVSKPYGRCLPASKLWFRHSKELCTVVLVSFLTLEQCCVRHRTAREAMTEFEWPWQYSFPPFFTIQPTLATKQKQLEAWSNLILNYHRSQRLFVLDVTEALSSPLFFNRTISRKLSADGLREILNFMSKNGTVTWTDKQQTRCYVFWRSPEEWAKLIYDWAESTGNTNTVCTLFELVNGDDTKDTEFTELDTDVLKMSLQVLEKQGKAEVISFDGNEGVKFF
ncbi:vacuolar protein-sorting-associated protein 25-like [Ornithodoros turicata]|uniref:vacuolar protein-sorting-associated protein 25-like n=1 Tax=Ornithodoros turicata TaxID=34597 RepID=UPI003139FDF1